MTMNKTAAPRRAVLIDLENLLVRATRRDMNGFWVDAAEAEERLRRVVELAGPADYTLAVGSQPAWNAGWAALLATGIEGRICPAGKDSADNELLEVADHLYSHGFHTITIVSGDAIFAQLAERPGLHLHVLAPDRTCASKHLMAAGEQARVVVPHAAWRSSHRRGRRGSLQAV